MNVSVWGNVDEVVEEMKYLASPCHRSRMENLRMKVDRGMPWVKREERKAKDKGRVRVSWGLARRIGCGTTWETRTIQISRQQFHVIYPSFTGRSRPIRSFVVRFEESQEDIHKLDLDPGIVQISSLSTRSGEYRGHRQDHASWL